MKISCIKPLEKHGWLTRNSMDLKNKRALVTGGARRLGSYMVRALAQEGMEIVLHYRGSEKEARSLQRELEEKGTKCHLLQSDLGSAEERKVFISQLEIKKLRPHVIINSASIFPEQNMWDWDEADLLSNMSLHLTAARDLSSMLRGSEEGAIINLLDSRIQDYDRKHIPYHFSKKALFQLTRMLAVEMAPRVRVNAIAPGLILPPEGKGEEYMEEMKQYNPLNASGTPEDIVSTLLFLLKSPFITGQVIYVDGGRNLKGSFYG